MATKNEQLEIPQQRKRLMGIGTDVLRYFDQHKDIVVYLKDMAKDLGYPEDRIQGNVNSLRSRNVGDSAKHLETVTLGQSWIWRSKAKDLTGEKPSGELIEVVFTTEKGTKIGKGEDGQLYSLRPLDI